MGTLLFGLTSMVCLHMSTLEPSDSHTLATLLRQYLFFVAYKLLFSKSYRSLCVRLKKGKQAQEELLLWWLKENSQTEYGKRYDFSSIKSREEFVARHPLTTFTHYEHYMDRLVNGEKNILTKRDPVYFALSSGTTGKNKVYPKSTYEMHPFMKYLGSRFYVCRDRYDKLKLRRQFDFTLHHPPRTSPCGIPMGGVGMYWSRSNKIGIVPSCIDEISQEAPTYYVQAIFALPEKDLVLFNGFSSDLMYSLFKFIENYAEDICEDIKQGHIRPFEDLPEKTRMKLNTYLKPKPRRAEELRGIIAKGSERMALNIWPRLEAVQVCKTGGFAHCTDILVGSYLKGAKVMFGIHGGTEGLYGISLETQAERDDIITFMPDCCFLEFISIDDIEKEQPRTFFLDQVQYASYFIY